MDNLTYLIDGTNIDIETINLKDNILNSYFKYQKGDWIADFVGFIIPQKSNELPIISFPKNYESIKLNKNFICKKDIENLRKLLTLTKTKTNMSVSEGVNSNFPCSAYISICNYYQKFGLFFENMKKTRKGYYGKINWHETLNKSKGTISNFNLVIFPFYIQKNIHNSMFITKCMDYVLADGYKYFGSFFELGIKYYSPILNDKMFSNYKYIKDILIRERYRYFKNSEILLINNLIEYFNWKNFDNDYTIYATKNFSAIWEIIVNSYLNHHFSYDKILNRLSFSGQKELCQTNNFQKFPRDSMYHIETNNKNGFSIFFDHLYIDDTNKTAYLFDSKYYLNLKELNYKQFCYHFILRDFLNNINKSDYLIIDGLVLPSNRKEIKLHIDMSNNIYIPLKEVIIYECYLSVSKIMDIYLEERKFSSET